MLKKILILLLAVGLAVGMPVLAEDEAVEAAEENQITQSDDIKIELLTYIGVISEVSTIEPDFVCSEKHRAFFKEKTSKCS